MLRQHREFNEATERDLLKKKREMAAELERKRLERRQAEEAAARRRELGLDVEEPAQDVSQDLADGTVVADADATMADSSVILAIDEAISTEAGATIDTMEADIAVADDDAQAQLAAADASILTVEPAVEAAAAEAAGSILAAQTATETEHMETEPESVRSAEVPSVGVKETAEYTAASAPSEATEGCSDSGDLVEEGAESTEAVDANKDEEKADESVVAEIQKAASETNSDAGDEANDQKGTDAEEEAEAEAEAEAEEDSDSKEENESDGSSDASSSKERSETPAEVPRRPLTRRQSALQKAQLSVKDDEEKTPARNGKGKAKTKAKTKAKDNSDGAASPVRTRRSRRGRQDVEVMTSDTELPSGITKEMLKEALAKTEFERSHDVTDSKQLATKRRQFQIQRADQPGQDGDENRDGTEEPTGVSDLEAKFSTVKNLLDESTLASLRKVNRRMVPNKYRLEVNFLTNRALPDPGPEATQVADDEVILSVCLFNPRTPTAKMEEYLVLGSQTLTVLRDAFYCISDFLVSQRDETNVNTKDKKVSSSYFFIENTFYNDMRSPLATDYSRVIMEWANDPERQENNPKLQGLQSRLMDGARFQDLSIRLKYPYIFMHQGDCEHVLMFTDLRLLGPNDDQHVESYPKQVFRTRHMRHKCRMCSAYPAQYVTKSDFHSGMSPCYFCEKCYTPFHFDHDGKLMLEHEVFPYANVNLM
ncbi:hypothetical protein DL89DRAFT_4486 [Linderina pennispora]|uniref:snRNA-activating protein complex subunit 3 n=2 Tax=Linderina TaxID=4867 RepID=A0A1Y1WK15_9FUNG|nr:uncharacterized protein DL89DRAFT_4486 [Linderina pennispora]ORX73822.1 hypothetical protein DL89DRAFT_4486 [Linderina pennispora]